MKKIFLTLVLLFSASNVYAAACSQMIGQIDDLDDATKQTLIVECEQKKLEATKAAGESIVTVTDEDGNISTEKLSEWGKVAQEWAKALGLAAQELGIAVDEFLGTSAGKITAALIIYKVMGDAILGIFIGIPLLFFSWYITWKLFKFISIKEYENKEVQTWGGRTKYVKIPQYNSVKQMSENEASSLWVIGIGTVISTLFILFVIIF